MKNPFCLSTLFIVLAFFPTSADSSPQQGENEDKNGFEEILPDIYRLQDACNIYLLRSGDSGILIDAGSDRLAEALNPIGVKRIDWILHTHYHRDQCLGTAALKNRGAETAIGISEEPFQKPGVDRGLPDGEVITWNQYSIRVINTPGHTRGSVSYLVESDGQMICFSGDLIIRGGYVHNLYSMQWVYLQQPGIDSSITSIDKISLLDPKLMLPSHGPIIKDPQADIRKLKSRLMALQEKLTIQRAGRWNWSGFVQVSEHVIQDCGTTSQLIVSGSGEALLFDCGRDFTSERLSEAKQKFGIKHIAVIIPSHWHYDHIDGIPALAESEGAEVWIWEKLREHLEQPENFLTTCWTNTKLNADRILSEGEKFEWGGYSFQVFHNPVHMEQQMGLSVLVDGLKFYFTADGSSSNRNGYMRSSIHCYNGISTRTGLIKTAQSFYEADPYICIPAHSNGFTTHNDTRQEFREWAVKTTDAITGLLSPGHSELGFNPYWCTFYPAKIKINPGEEKQVMLRINNTANHGVSGKIWLKSSDEIVFRKEKMDYLIAPGTNTGIPVIIKARQKARPGTHIITADIEFDDEFFGEYPQGYITIDE
ncbi:MAG: hypothetical protein AMS26_21505 [Bacteroides sp. SM23_62]|nr:MAG: hypothetical protein AMS26_21505 [Bacteroides sp. SM23_62]